MLTQRPIKLNNANIPPPLHSVQIYFLFFLLLPWCADISKCAILTRLHVHAVYEYVTTSVVDNVKEARADPSHNLASSHSYTLYGQDEPMVGRTIVVYRAVFSTCQNLRFIKYYKISNYVQVLFFCLLYCKAKTEY